MKKTEIKCIKIAALCSQLNVGPMSETFDLYLGSSKNSASIRKMANTEVLKEILDDKTDGNKNVIRGLRTEMDTYLNKKTDDSNDYERLIIDLLDFKPTEVNF